MRGRETEKRKTRACMYRCDLCVKRVKVIGTGRETGGRECQSVCVCVFLCVLVD